MKLYNIKLIDGTDLVVYVGDIDWLHRTITNNPAMIMFYDFEDRAVLIDSSSIIAVFEEDAA